MIMRGKNLESNERIIHGGVSSQIVKVKPEFHLFWGGPCSQWYPCKFYDPAMDMFFNCTEQYMMYHKAKLFGDEDAMDKIMSTQDPKIQKGIGRKVKNFDADKWNEVCRTIVYRGNLFKFTQNRKLLVFLMEHKDEYFVEASPYDKIWGIGLGEEDPDALDKSKWLGTNWLGVAINQVRDTLLEWYC